MSRLESTVSKKQRTIGHRLAGYCLLPAACCLLPFLAPTPALAHPMGNFSISHYAGIYVDRVFVELRYVLDMAEIPTFQEMQQTGIKPQANNPDLDAYLTRKGEALRQGLVFELDGQLLALQLVSQQVIFPPGAGGMPTMKLGFLFRAMLADGEFAVTHQLHYRDSNFPERAGWKEVVARAAAGVTLIDSSVPQQDRSQQLSNYPTDLLNSPPQVLEANISFSLSGFRGPGQDSKQKAVGSRQQDEDQTIVGRSFAVRGGGQESRQKVVASRQPAEDQTPGLSAAALSPIQNPESPNPKVALEANKQGTPRNAFTDLLTRRQFGFWFLLSAALIAASLGAFHALEPGHGKTIVAAYLVGSRGAATHACLLGLIVTASHTAGVYLLGLVTLYASKYVVPEHLYPWLGALSGATIAGLGLYLFIRRSLGSHHPHSHTHGHSHHHHHHDHHGHEHTHDGDHHDEQTYNHHHNEDPHVAVSLRELLALGVTGGIVPCPAALVVLLSAVAVRRVGFGLFLILAFSVGLAAVLIVIGLLMVYAGRFMSRLRGEGPLLTRWLPMASAAVITLLGLAITVRALVAFGVTAIKI
jgi:ABC-type nickel/cobalt efflux system permease component RcnA